jgi:hypothetical protein
MWRLPRLLQRLTVAIERDALSGRIQPNHRAAFPGHAIRFSGCVFGRGSQCERENQFDLLSSADLLKRDVSSEDFNFLGLFLFGYAFHGCPSHRYAVGRGAVREAQGYPGNRFVRAKKHPPFMRQTAP